MEEANQVPVVAVHIECGNESESQSSDNNTRNNHRTPGTSQTRTGMITGAHDDSNTDGQSTSGVIRIRSNKKRNKKANPEEWERYVSKKSRSEGKPYVSRSIVNGIKGQKERPGRVLGPTCGSKICSQGNFKRQCFRFSEEERTNIHYRFWNNITWDQRKQFVVSHVGYFNDKTNRGENNKVRNRITYHLTNSHNERIIVCKKMFLNTLSLGEKSVLTWVQGSEYGILAPPSVKINTEYKKEVRITSVPEFFKLLPRERVKNKFYLASKYETKDEVYKDYITFCQEKNLQVGSRVTFNRAFIKANLSFRSSGKKNVIKNIISTAPNNTTPPIHKPASSSNTSTETAHYNPVQNDCMYQQYQWSQQQPYM